MIYRGEIHDSKTLCGLMLASHHLQTLTLTASGT
jgi:hypothetical protein